MNFYIKYATQFWRAVRSGSIPSSVVSVYFYLLHVCNSYFWDMPFSCSTSMICEKLCISREAFTKARFILADLRLISFTEGFSRFNHPTYSILDLTEDLTKQQTAKVTADLTENLTDDMTSIYTKDKEEKNKIVERTSLCAAPLSASSSTSTNNYVDFEAFRAFFNQCMEGRQIPAIKVMNSKRKGMVRARIKEYGKEAVAQVIRKAADSDFLNGGTGSFIASFEWILKPNNFLKVLEGNYDKRVMINCNGRQNIISNSGRRTAEDIYGGAARAIASLEQEAQQLNEDLPVV